MAQYKCGKTGKPVIIQAGDITPYYASGLAGYGIALFTWSSFSHVEILYTRDENSLDDDMFNRNWSIGANPPTVQVDTLSSKLKERKCALVRPKKFVGISSFTEEAIRTEMDRFFCKQIDTRPYGFSTIAKQAWYCISQLWSKVDDIGVIDINKPVICSELISQFMRTVGVDIAKGKKDWETQPKDFYNSSEIVVITDDLRPN